MGDNVDVGQVVYAATRALPAVFGNINSTLTHTDVLVFAFDLVGLVVTQANVQQVDAYLKKRGFCVDHYEFHGGQQAVVVFVIKKFSPFSDLVLGAAIAIAVTLVATLLIGIVLDRI